MEQLAELGYILGGIGAGVAAIGLLARKGARGFRTLHRAGQAIARLAAIGDEAAWPNGSEDLPTFLDRLYGWVRDLHQMLSEHIDDHEAYEIDYARGTREWDEVGGTT